MIEYLDKQELKNKIEHNICRWCNNYKDGNFCGDCAICKVSQVFSTIALATPHYFSPDGEIHFHYKEKSE